MVECRETDALSLDERTRYLPVQVSTANTMTGLCISPPQPEHRTRQHPERVERLHAIREAVDHEDWTGRVERFEAAPATDTDLGLVHSRRLVDAVYQTAETGGGHMDPDTQVSSRSWEAALLAVGAGKQAVDGVLDGRWTNALCAMRPPGHHATPTRAMGFCLFNNIAIAARHAVQERGLERVAILDWDVHHGNGTQDTFYDDPHVYFFSIHQSPYYPGTGHPHERGGGKAEGTILNLPQAAYTPAERTRADFAQGLEEVRQFQPELILLSAGFDSHADDFLGGLLLTEEDFREMTREVMVVAEQVCQGRVVSMLEGGYNLDSLAASFVAHLQALSE